MPLRSVARKLGAPAVAALQRASSTRVSPAAGSGRRALRSSQSGEGSKQAHRKKDAQHQATLKFMENWNEEKERNYLEVSRLVDNLPRTIAVSAAASVFAVTFVMAYAVGAYE